ncbi:MAG: 3-hydroxyacyl-CoA dehydrogenase family protein [Gemmatimonadota bacterium]
MIRKVAVIGAGTMGHGIAQVTAAADCDVVLIDTASELVERGVSRIRENLDAGIEHGKLTRAERDAVLGRIATATDYAPIAGCDLAIEAVPEKLALKLSLLERIEALARADCIIASNTSSLSINDMQKSLARPDRMLGLHFFNPVHINKLVEIVRGTRTSEATLATATEFVRRIGKEPITVNDSPGFATSRLGVLLGLEAMRMLEEGVASATDIDKALELGYRHPMGPLRLTDLVGLDVRLDIARYLHEKLGAEQFRPPRILEQMVAQGKLGKKSGEGFYQW